MNAYRKYRGQWIALSSDGLSVLANAEDLDTLEDRLAADGYDPQQVLFDRVEDDDESFGGVEFL